MEDQGRGIKVEVRGVKVGGGVKVWGVEVVVKVWGQDRGRGHGWGVKVWEEVKVWGVKIVVKVGGQGCGVKVRGMIGGHSRVSVGGQSRGVNVRRSMSGGGVMVRG